MGVFFRRVRIRRVLIRGFLLAAVAAAIALASRSLLVRLVAHRFEDASDALAEVAHRLPAPGRELVVPLALPPVETITVPPLASTDAQPPEASTNPSLNPSLSAGSLSAGSSASTSPSMKGQKAKLVVPTPPLRVTRAEVDAAIAAKMFGARTKLARDASGKPVGLALYGTGALARFGVQDGDVLVSANGFSLRTPEDAFAALGSLKDAQRVTVVLQRGTGSYAVSVEVAPETPQ